MKVNSNLPYHPLSELFLLMFNSLVHLIISCYLLFLILFFCLLPFLNLLLNHLFLHLHLKVLNIVNVVHQFLEAILLPLKKLFNLLLIGKNYSIFFLLASIHSISSPSSNNSLSSVSWPPKYPSSMHRRICAEVLTGAIGISLL